MEGSLRMAGFFLHCSTKSLSSVTFAASIERPIVVEWTQTIDSRSERGKTNQPDVQEGVPVAFSWGFDGFRGQDLAVQGFLVASEGF